LKTWTTSDGRRLDESILRAVSNADSGTLPEGYLELAIRIHNHRKPSLDAAVASSLGKVGTLRPEESFRILGEIVDRAELSATFEAIVALERIGPSDPARAAELLRRALEISKKFAQSWRRGFIFEERITRTAQTIRWRTWRDREQLPEITRKTLKELAKATEEE
jgi:hypothetical protein